MTILFEIQFQLDVPWDESVENVRPYADVLAERQQHWKAMLKWEMLTNENIYYACLHHDGIFENLNLISDQS